MKEINLFENKINCCGCGACASICPKKAIKMKTDEYGFLFPEIDENQCVKCGICKSVCAYQEGMVKNEPLQVYAAVNKNKEQLLNSASGGVFSAIATQVLKNGGVVLVLHSSLKMDMQFHIIFLLKMRMKLVKFKARNMYRVQ